MSFQSITRSFFFSILKAKTVIYCEKLKKISRKTQWIISKKLSKISTELDVRCKNLKSDKKEGDNSHS